MAGSQAGTSPPVAGLLSASTLRSAWSDLVKMLNLPLMSPSFSFYNHASLDGPSASKVLCTHLSLSYRKLFSEKEWIFYLIDCH